MVSAGTSLVRSISGVLFVMGLMVGVGHPSLSAIAVTDTQADAPAVLFSRQLLAARHLKVGDLVELSGDPSGANPQRFRIAGSYEPMPDPIRVTSERLEARLHLPDLLRLTGEPGNPQDDDSLSAINVKLRRPEDAEAFARDWSARVPTIGVRSSRGGDTERNPFEVLSRFHLAIATLTVITAAVFLLALMVLLADERRETVGTLRLIGLTRARVLAQVLLEGALIAGAGAIFGVALATLTEGVFNAFFQWRYDTSLIFVRVTPSIAWRSIAVALPLGMAASLLASWALVRSNTLTLVRR
jgi:predicted lysophospholipase L1 biosynthesis ABC-type transport system permease subunit